jgi:selenocysteine lyase/cysteine desulfurase
MLRMPFAPRRSRPATAEDLFRAAYPRYATTARLDQLRATEYRRFDEQRHTYLDYTGGGVYAAAQLRAHADLLGGHVFGNPHSDNLASRAMTELVERSRATVLEYFHADPDEYVAIFTANATGALKLVGEAYPFEPASQLLLSADNHNSVNGIREFARRHGAQVDYAPLSRPSLRLDLTALAALLDRGPGAGPRLFAYPAQSNFTGVQHPLELIETAHGNGWDVLLDAAAFVPTSRLDLARWHPDFVSISFYKMFGYPTGTGALLARRSALARLRRPWFAGGTITMSSVSAAGAPGAGFYLTPGATSFEDGTVNYLSLPAVEFGLRWLADIGTDVIQSRILPLTGWLLQTLAGLRHANGEPVVRLYGPPDLVARGATVSFNIMDPSGRRWDCVRVEARANAERISLRAGCHCNPGAREAALDLAPDLLAACFAAKDTQSYDAFLAGVEGQREGVVRASFGLASSFADAARLAEFVAGLANQPATDEPS